MSGEKHCQSHRLPVLAVGYLSSELLARKIPEAPKIIQASVTVLCWPLALICFDFWTLKNQAGTGMEASFPLFSSSVRQAADPSVTGLTGKAKCASWCSSGMSVIREHVLSGQFVALPTGRNPHLLLPSWSKFFGWGGHGP